MKVIIDNDGIITKAVVDHKREQMNEKLKKHINSFPLVIDRTVFRKTKEEKELVNKLRTQFKNKNNNE